MRTEQGMNLDSFLESLGETDQQMEEPEVCRSRGSSTTCNAIGWGGLSFGSTK